MPADAPARREANNLKAVSSLDFMTLPVAFNKGASRDRSAVRVERPWARLYFGDLVLQSGWWRLECEGEGADAGVELRLSTPQNPLVIVRGGEGRAARILLHDAEPFEVSLLASAWPGLAGFEICRFVRLGLADEAAVVARSLARVATRKDGPALLVRAARRVLAKQAIGIGATSKTPALPPDTPLVGAAVERPRTIVTRGAVSAVLQADDLLHIDAFAIAEAELIRNPNAVAVFSDADEGGRVLPHPAWDPELTRYFPYPDAPFFVRAGEGDSKPPNSLAEIATRNGAASLARISLPLVRRVLALRTLPAVPQPHLSRTPRVSAIIPTKLRVDLLQLCLEGLAQNTAYPDLQVVVVDNGCADPRFHRIIDDASRRLDLVKVEDFGGFNFPRLIQSGVDASDGKILLLLNDDVAAQEAGWLHRMVESAMRDDTGAVGARLTYPDGSIQHAGVALGLSGVCGHLWKGTAKYQAVSNPYVSLPGSRLAVTGACMAVRREVYESVNGMDGDAFPVALNDIDFCLRLVAKGYSNIYRGDVVLIHYESQSRGNDDATLERRRRLTAETSVFRERWRGMIESDPWSSPAFDPLSESGAVHPAVLRPTSDYLLSRA
jgi:GT2 family glycosyltransferase